MIESEEYEELVLANPENPARVERVTAVTGSIDSVRAYQSPDGVTQLLLVNLRREDDPGPALVLFSRQRGGWKQIWSSFGSPDGAQIIPVCYGFSTEAGSGQAFVHMLYAAGDSLDEPLRAIRLDARGKTHSVTLPKRELSRADDYLYLGERIRESGLGYSYSVQSKGGANGLLLVEDGGKSIRVISTDRYEPLTTVVDSEGALGIVAMSEADGGQVRVFDADSGESVAVTRMSHARGAIPLTGHGKWTAGAALIGTAGTSHTTLWSVYTLRGERIAGPWRSTQVVRDWSTPSWPYFGIQSMDELPASDGQALVLGLSIEHEAAIATVRIPQ